MSPRHEHLEARLTFPDGVVRIEAFGHSVRCERPPVRERILSKLELLRRWRQDGVPVEYIGRVPPSLEQARTWELAELGIFSIGSKSAFVRTHPEWGGAVHEIAKLVKELADVYRRPQPKKSVRQEAIATHEKADKLEIALALASRQWHDARAEAERQVRERHSLEASLADLQERFEDAKKQISQLEGEIQSLRRRYSDASGVRKLGRT